MFQHLTGFQGYRLKIITFNYSLIKLFLMLNFVRGDDRGETAVLKNMVYKLSKQLSKEQATRIGLGK